MSPGTAGQVSGGTSQNNFVDPKQIYNYLISKGISKQHALGMLANIEAESGFNAGALGDNNISGGLFQHHDERFAGLINYAGKDWHKDWKKQIDYALTESATQTYLNTQFNTPEDASEWFTLNWEYPADASNKTKERKANIAKYNY